jgi:hypothetical protein
VVVVVVVVVEVEVEVVAGGPVVLAGATVVVAGSEVVVVVVVVGETGTPDRAVVAASSTRALPPLQAEEISSAVRAMERRLISRVCQTLGDGRPERTADLEDCAKLQTEPPLVVCPPLFRPGIGTKVPLIGSVCDPRCRANQFPANMEFQVVVGNATCPTCLTCGCDDLVTGSDTAVVCDVHLDGKGNPTVAVGCERQGNIGQREKGSSVDDPHEVGIWVVHNRADSGVAWVPTN